MMVAGARTGWGTMIGGGGGGGKRMIGGGGGVGTTRAVGASTVWVMTKEAGWITG